MVKNLVMIVLSLTTLISAGWGWHERGEIRELRGAQARAAAKQAEEENTTIRDLRENLKHEQAAVETQKKHYESTIQMLNNRLAGRSSASALAQAGAKPDYAKAMQAIKAQLEQSSRATSATAAQDKAGGKGANSSPLMGQVAKMMKNPEMRKMVQSQQKAVLEMSYGQLYSLLNLPPEQMEKFKGLLEKKQMQAIDVGLELLDGSLPAEQKAARQKQIVEMNAQINKEIEGLLGPENNSVYKSFEETQSERSQVQLFNQGLDSGMQLNDKQQLDLVFALHKVRGNFKFSSNLGGKNENLDLGSISPEMMNTYLEENKRLNTQYVDTASRMLTPAQLEKFRESIQQQQSMQELSLRMLFGVNSK